MHAASIVLDCGGPTRRLIEAPTTQPNACTVSMRAPIQLPAPSLGAGGNNQTKTECGLVQLRVSKAWLLWQVFVADAADKCVIMLRPHVYWATSGARVGSGMMHVSLQPCPGSPSAARLADFAAAGAGPRYSIQRDILLQVLPLAQQTASGACLEAPAPPFSAR